MLANGLGVLGLEGEPVAVARHRSLESQVPIDVKGVLRTAPEGLSPCPGIGDFVPASPEEDCSGEYEQRLGAIRGECVLHARPRVPDPTYLHR